VGVFLGMVLSFGVEVTESEDTNSMIVHRSVSSIAGVTCYVRSASIFDENFISFDNALRPLILGTVSNQIL